MEPEHWSFWDTQRLEDEYSPSKWSRRGPADWVFDNHVKLVTQVSNQVKEEIQCDLDIPYGEREGEKFDIFGAQLLPNDAPVFVYIHGGYWQALDRSISSYSVTPQFKAGHIVVVVGYELAPKVGLKDIILEIQSAISAVLKWAAERGSRSVVIAGHSAGSHLASMLLHDPQWQKNEPHLDLLHGMVHISGVFDVIPLVATSMNLPLNLDNETAKLMSPLHCFNQSMEKVLNIKQLLVVGENDPTEFKRQTSTYAQALLRAGFTDVHCKMMESLDHFNIVEELRNEDYELTRLIVKLIS
ncbi:kynurenine formamidase-like [Daphnia pulex]|uniref:kynurenine formamidase-like n=1 Tax=Daphnia pulex TaxID=6669 RepID=UPI001EE1289F|nr:kynurenine formamidase-like [Daphnia pulex]